MKGLTLSLLHLHFAFCILHFEFKFPAKNSEFFRFIYLNFPPKKLDSIGGGVALNINGVALSLPWWGGLVEKVITVVCWEPVKFQVGQGCQVFQVFQMLKLILGTC